MGAHSSRINKKGICSVMSRDRIDKIMTDETRIWIHKNPRYREIYNELMKLDHLLFYDLCKTFEDNFPKDFQYKEDEKFIFGYARLKLFNFRHLNLLSLSPSTIKSLARRLIKNPWEYAATDIYALSGLSYGTINKFLTFRLSEVSDDYYRAFIRINIRIRNHSTSTSKNIEDNYTTHITNLYDLYVLHNRMRDDQTFKNIKIREKKELKWVYDKTRANLLRVLVYDMKLPDREEFYKFSYGSSKQSITWRKKIEKEKKCVYKYIDIYPLIINRTNITNLYNACSDFIMKYYAQNSYENRLIEHIDLEQSIDINLLSIPQKQNPSDKTSIDNNVELVVDTIEKEEDSRENLFNMIEENIRRLINRKPYNPVKYYYQIFNRDLKNDLKLLSDIRPNVISSYKEYEKERGVIYSKKVIKEYKDFAKKIVGKYKKSATGNIYNVDKYALIMLIDTIKNFDKKGYKHIITHCDKLTQQEKISLERFYTRYIELHDSCHVVSEESLLNTLYVLKGKLISKEVKLAAIKYLLSKATELYIGIYYSIIKCWSDGLLDLDGLKFEDLEDYKMK